SQNNFILNYHPVVNIVTNNITGLEVLLRWEHPEDGLMSAAQFIHQIEGDKTFIFVGEWILKKSLNQLKYWHDLGLKPLTLSMNLSSHQFYEPNLVSVLNTALKNIDIDPYSFELEVTESTILKDKSSSQRILLDLQDLGIKVAIDDFDMDTFSIKELRKFAFNTIKIDQQLIHKLTLKSDEFVKIRFLMSMAEDYNLNVVAEGVETREQLNLLRSLDCETVQGYLFDYPLSAEDATDVLKSNWLGRQ
ncbi:MAG: EAL domain-containing protein, partial [Thermosynechococcaceae cyanobacterium]